MTRKRILYSLLCLTIVGALVVLLASNFFFTDVANKDVGLANSTVLVTFPAGALAITFALAIFYFIRTYKHPDCVKRISRLYLILVIVFNALALVANIIGSIKEYGSLISENPFPGYSLIFLILEVLLIGGAIFGLIKVKAMKDDEGKVKISVGYVFKTIGWFLFIMLMLNRFGNFLFSPFYIYWRTFYKTFPFYLFLLVPLYLGIVEIMHIFKMADRKKMFILTFVGYGLTVILFTYSALMGINDTGFISALSEAMPLERLASMPMEILIHALAYLGVSTALLVQTIKTKQE